VEGVEEVVVLVREVVVAFVPLAFAAASKHSSRMETSKRPIFGIASDHPRSSTIEGFCWDIHVKLKYTNYEALGAEVLLRC
jgi:hypothetical protein